MTKEVLIHLINSGSVEVDDIIDYIYSECKPLTYDADGFPKHYIRFVEERIALFKRINKNEAIEVNPTGKLKAEFIKWANLYDFLKSCIQ